MSEEPAVANANSHQPKFQQPIKSYFRNDASFDRMVHRGSQIAQSDSQRFVVKQEPGIIDGAVSTLIPGSSSSVGHPPGENRFTERKSFSPNVSDGYAHSSSMLHSMLDQAVSRNSALHYETPSSVAATASLGEVTADDSLPVQMAAPAVGVSVHNNSIPSNSGGSINNFLQQQMRSINSLLQTSGIEATACSGNNNNNSSPAEIRIADDEQAQFLPTEDSVAGFAIGSAVKHENATNTVLLNGHGHYPFIYSHGQRMRVARYHPVQCDECNKIFNSPSHLKRHKLIHLTIRPFPCGVCGKTFYRKDKLRMHEKTHVRKTCQQCGQMYERVYDLNAHVRESGHVHDFTLEILLDPVSASASSASNNNKNLMTMMMKREGMLGASSSFGHFGSAEGNGVALLDRSTLESQFAENPYLSQLIASCGQYATDEEESVDDFDGQMNGIEVDYDDAADSMEYDGIAEGTPSAGNAQGHEENDEEDVYDDPNNYSYFENDVQVGLSNDSQQATAIDNAIAASNVSEEDGSVAAAESSDLAGATSASHSAASATCGASTHSSMGSVSVATGESAHESSLTQQQRQPIKTPILLSRLTGDVSAPAKASLIGASSVVVSSGLRQISSATGGSKLDSMLSHATGKSLQNSAVASTVAVATSQFASPTRYLNNRPKPSSGAMFAATSQFRRILPHNQSMRTVSVASGQQQQPQQRLLFATSSASHSQSRSSSNAPPFLQNRPFLVAESSTAGRLQQQHDGHSAASNLQQPQASICANNRSSTLDLNAAVSSRASAALGANVAPCSGACQRCCVGFKYALALERKLSQMEAEMTQFRNAFEDWKDKICSER